MNVQNTQHNLQMMYTFIFLLPDVSSVWAGGKKLDQKDKA